MLNLEPYGARQNLLVSESKIHSSKARLRPKLVLNSQERQVYKFLPKNAADLCWLGIELRYRWYDVHLKDQKLPIRTHIPPHKKQVLRYKLRVYGFNESNARCYI